MLGINEPALKALVQGRLAPDASQLLERLEPVRQALDAESILVMDAGGRAVGISGKDDDLMGCVADDPVVKIRLP